MAFLLDTNVVSELRNRERVRADVIYSGQAEYTF
jgi:predicted nucleic acid-binding protein